MKKITTYILVAFAGAMLWSCTGSFNKVNTDPDRPNSAPLTNVLAYTIRYTTENLFDPWNDMNEPSTYGGHIAKIQYIDEAKYSFRTNVVENKWYYLYLSLNNARNIQERAEADGLKNMQGVAQVWEAILIQIATDTWRDCPFSEAGHLADGILTPKYDTQEEIYPALLTLLAEAAKNLEEGTDDLGAGDILFSGDTESWLRFCNSLRLRLAMRISGVSPTTAKPIVESLAKSAMIFTNEQNAFFNWPGSSPYYEPWANDRRTRDDHGVSDVLINILKDRDDPRLSVYAKPAVKDGEYRGFVIGAPAVASDLSTLSRIGARFRDNLAGFTVYYRSAETWFHLAEAAQLGWSVGWSANDAYNLAVLASMDENGVNELDATAYLLGAGKFDNQMNTIYLQEWISLFKQGMEAWSLYRRTGIPTTHYVAPGRSASYASHNTPPLRYPYPISESSLNATNNKVYADDVVNDFWGKRMWWDTRKNAN